MNEKNQEIYHISTELAGLVKVGGLADVVYGLSKRLLSDNLKVTVVLPYYTFLDKSLIEPSKRSTLTTKLLGKITLHKTSFENIPLVLIQAHTEEEFFNRDSVYGEADDFDRFLWFTLACLEFFKTLENSFTVHVHDWPVAILPALLKEYTPNLNTKSVLTIHNLRHQGRCSKKHLATFFKEPISTEFFEKVKDPQNPSLINLMKAGIVFADHITTVSPTYSLEIQEKKLGYELAPLLKLNNHKLSGILNGIDYTYWDPKNDPYLQFHYGNKDIKTAISSKNQNKISLYSHLKMEQSDKPLFCTVTRLDHQKGPDLILHAIDILLELEYPVILLGTPTSDDIRKKFDSLALKHQNNPRFHFHQTFNEKLAHQIYAASTYILIPSIFEPCGLSQIIAMRYGTIPLVRKTGGLADTVIDVDDTSPNKPTGLVFETPDKESIETLIHRAIELYANKTAFKQVFLNGLSQDFSWKSSAKRYELLYETI